MTLTVATQLVQDGWEVLESEPKTDSGARVVALDEGTVDVLRTQLAKQAAERLKWGEAWQDAGRIFTQEDGSWLHPGWLTDHFGRLVEASDLPPVRLHDLRHLAASLMLAAGIDIKIVSENHGHRDARITQDIYQSVLPKIAAEAAEATARMVPRAAKAKPTRTAGLTSGSQAQAEIISIPAQPALDREKPQVTASESWG